MKLKVKNVVHGIFILLALPMAALSGFGRSRLVFLTGAHFFALAPGILGDYLRTAYYWMTLKSCSLQCRISFGCIFSNPGAVVENGVYIGPYCVMGLVSLGRHTQVASQVQILSGARQHARDEKGNVLGSEGGVFERVTVGANSWIGAAAILMANVGERTTVGAGAVVNKELPDDVIAVGNPARIVRSAVPSV